MLLRKMCLGLALLTVLSACTSDGTPAAAPSITPTESVDVAPSPSASTAPSPSPSPSPSPAPREIEISSTSIDDVPIGTPGDEAERRLRRALGPPRSDPLCEDLPGRWLTWGTLTAVLGQEDPRNGGPVVLVGWTVDPGPSRFRHALPYDVQPGTAMRDVLRRVPSAAGVMGDNGGYFVHTDRLPGMIWASTANDASGRVDGISFRGGVCED